MAVDTAFLITSFVTLFVIIDPIGLMPIFIAFTPGMSAQQRRAVAFRSCIIAFFILALFAFFGEAAARASKFAARCGELFP